MNGSPALLNAPMLRERLTEPTAPRLLDVRTPGEFATVHIPGSYNVPLDTLSEHRDELTRYLDEVVLICRTGNRAAQAERTLAAAGMGNVHVLDGGLAAWETSGAPVTRGPVNRWELERQVRLTAGTLVVLGVLLSLIVPGMQWMSAAVGAGLMFAALTNTCAMGMLLAKLPFNRGPSCDIESIVAELVRDGRRS